MTNLNINDYLNEINQTTKTIDKASHKPTPLIEKKAKTPTIKPFSLDLLDSLAVKADTIRNYSVKWLIKDFILPQSLGKCRKWKKLFNAIFNDKATKG